VTSCQWNCANSKALKGAVLSDHPKVSVCVPTYNHAHFIRDAIESVLAQTFSDFELVVVDNCSTDNTREVVAGYAAQDARVRYVRNPENVGPRENLNRCIAEACGDYIKILCADDLLEPACLESSVRLLESRPSVVMVATARHIVDVQLKPLRVASYAGHDLIVDGRSVINYSLFNGNYIGEPGAVMFRRRDALRGFNTAFRLMIDLEMWLHILEEGDFAYIAEPLCTFRVHPGQETNNVVASLDFIDEEFWLLRKYAGQPYVDNSVLNRFKWACKVAWVIPLKGYATVDNALLSRKVREYAGYGVLYWVVAARRQAGRLLARLGMTGD